MIELEELVESGESAEKVLILKQGKDDHWQWQHLCSASAGRAYTGLCHAFLVYTILTVHRTPRRRVVNILPSHSSP